MPISSVLKPFKNLFFSRKKEINNVEELLKQSRESLEFALQSGRMATWDINLETDFISCSKEMLDLWEIDHKEFKGQRSLLQSKVHPDDLGKMKQEIEKSIRNESLYEFEYRINPSPGVTRWVQSRGRRTFAPGSNRPVRFSGIIYDITERKEKEEALALAMKARDQFFMIASHELRTPLTCLQLQLQVTEWDLNYHFPEAFTADKIRIALNKQQMHMARLIAVVNNILDESRISEGRLNMQFADFDLRIMANDVMNEFKVTAESADIEIFLTASESIIGKWDRFRIEQVFLNLLMNAVRYGNKKPIHVEILKDENHAKLIVRDQGIGIKAEDQPRIFERFERATQNESTGMGLGLYISNNIVRAHGGEIKIKSEHGKGSTFTVLLPL